MSDNNKKMSLIWRIWKNLCCTAQQYNRTD